MPVETPKPPTLHPRNQDLRLTRSEFVQGLYSAKVDEQCEALGKIGKLGEGLAYTLGLAPDVAALLADSSAKVRAAAAITLGQLGEVAVSAMEQVLALLEDDSISVRCAALQALGMLAPSSADHAGEIVTLLSDESPAEVRAAAALALGAMKAWSYTEEVRGCIQDDEAIVVEAGLGAVAKWDEDGQMLVGDVVQCLKHAKGSIRAAAAEALAKTGAAGERQAEAAADLLTDDNNSVRRAIVSYFEAAGTGAKKAAEKVAKGLSSRNGRVQAASAMALGHMKAVKYAKEVAALLDSPYGGDTSVALSAAGVEQALPVTLRRPGCAAAAALALMGPEGAAYTNDVAKQLSSDDAPAEATAAFLRALGMMGSAASAHEEKVRGMLKDTAAPVREAACFALGEMGQAAQSMEALSGRLKDSHPHVRAAAVLAVGKMEVAGPSPAGEMAKLLTDKVSLVKVAAIRALCSLGPPGHYYAADICRLTMDAHPQVRVTAAEALGDMGEHGASLCEDLVLLLEHHDGGLREAVLKSLSKMGDEALTFMSQIKKACCDPLEAVRSAADICAENLLAGPPASAPLAITQGGSTSGGGGEAAVTVQPVSTAILE